MKARILLTLFALACGAAHAFLINIPVPESIYEYRNDITGHYVMLWDRGEIQFVESGGAGPGWHRTGYVFGGFSVYTSYVPGSRMCRFYAPGPNSHFLTARDNECQGLRAHPESGWIFERDDISVYMPAGDGSCGANIPVYRLYNNRAAFNDTNHRHVADPAIQAELVSQGWIDEGVAFCSTGYRTPATEIETRGFSASPNIGFATPEACEDAPASASLTCMQVTGLAPMTNAITRLIPPAYSQPNPAFPLAADAVTGWTVNGGCINTALGAGAGPAIVQASFLESLCDYAPLLGVHIRGTDSPGAASVSRVFKFATALAADGSDSRFVPWADPATHSLTFNIEVVAKTVTNGLAGGKAQGEGILRLRDTTTNHQISIVYRIYDTNPAPDSIEYDAASQTTAIVTAFRDVPLVGELVHGNFIACSGPDCHQELTLFKVRITRDEFAAALALARGTDPALSPSPASYTMSSFQMRNETTLDGELGVLIGNVSLQASALAIDLPP